MAAHIAAIKHNLAQDLDCQATDINVKATTTEGLGFIGREQGIAGAAAVVVEQRLR